jgi:hypothetical protein
MAEDNDNIISVVDVAKMGVVIDTPPVALAPNIMTDVRNVRFKDGAIRKIEGEILLTDLELDTGIPTGYKLGDVQYLAVWEEPSIAPDQCYYITVRDFILNSSGLTLGQKVFVQNAIKSTDTGYLRRDITPPIGTALITTTGITATQASIGGTVLTVSDATGISLQDYVVGVGIPFGARVTNINSLDITISKGITEALSTTAVSFDKLYAGFSVSYDGWGHTLFNGGFAFVLNNGIDRPYHIKLQPEASAITDIELLELPGWDSYYGHADPVEDTWQEDTDLRPVYATGQDIDFTLNTLYVTKVTGTTTTVLIPEAGSPAGTNPPTHSFSTTATQGTVGSTTVDVAVASGIVLDDIVSGVGISIGTKVTDITGTIITISNVTTEAIPGGTAINFNPVPARANAYAIPSNFVPGDYPGNTAWVTPTAGFFQVYTNSETGITAISIGGLILDDTVSIQVRSRNVIRVSCGIIEGFGNLLVAGNLKITDSLDTTKTLRRAPGVVRVSDVANTDEFPTNWNPFASIASTADEFTLSETSVIKDMKTLQSNFYIYSTEGIHQLSLTGNPKAPISFSSVTETYGALSTKSVAEYDGRHFVIGKNDIYSFTGNPADIKSLCDNRTRVYFYNNLNPGHIDSTFLLANHRENEIWVNYVTKQSINGDCNEALIFNYRDNTWTIRDLNNVRSGDIGPIVGGGIPQATLALSGSSGNAGFTNVGNLQKQTLSFFSTEAYRAPRPHLDIPNQNRVTLDSTWSSSTFQSPRNARQRIRFSWIADETTYGNALAIPYRSSAQNFSGQEAVSVTWVLYAETGTTKRSIGITLTPGLVGLRNILNDIVDKMNNQAANFYTAFNTHYHARRWRNYIYLEASSTGSRTLFPITSVGSYTEPANGVWAYRQGLTQITYNPQNPQGDRYGLTNGIIDLGTGVNAKFPVPSFLSEMTAGTDVGKPEITATLTFPGVGTRSTSVYNMAFDGAISNTQDLMDRINFYFDVNNEAEFNFPENDGYRRISSSYKGTGGSPYASPQPTSTLQAWRETNIGLINPLANTFSFTTSDDTIIQKSKIVFSQDKNDGRPPRLAGTSDTITFNLPLGEVFTTALVGDAGIDRFDPDYLTSYGSPPNYYNPRGSEFADISDVAIYLNAQYNDNFGDVGQPVKYFTIGTPNYTADNRKSFTRINGVGPAVDPASPNLDPITWTITNGTSRSNVINNNNYPFYADSIPANVTTNTGAPTIYSTLTRATLKIINNGVSTTVLDKRYGEGPGRLALEPLSGINGVGESRYGDTGVSTDNNYLALYYNGGLAPGNVANGVAAPHGNILLDVMGALSPYTSLSVEADDSANPSSVIVKPLQYSSTTNYVESFVVSTGSEAQTAPVRTEFIGQNREGQTVAGTDSTLASTTSIDNTLGALRPWSSSKVNTLRRLPLFAQSLGTANTINAADLGFDFSGTDYVSFFERDQLSITTAFNTETVASMVLWADGGTRDAEDVLQRATLRIRTRGTNASGEESLLTSTAENDAKLVINSFVVATNYKFDTRVQGRFINYRIDDAALDYTAANNKAWSVSGLQLEILKGGTR